MLEEKQTYIYKSMRDCDIRLDLHIPEETVPQMPLIVWIHGGGLMFGSRDAIEAVGQVEMYLNAGFIVASIDYRLAPETKTPGIVEDVLDAFRWVREEAPNVAPADPDRIGVVGHSAGGYLALTCGWRVTPRPKAVVSFYGYGDPTGAWANTPLELPFTISADEAGKAVGNGVLTNSWDMEGRGKYYTYLRQEGLFAKEITGYDPETEADSLALFCPVLHVDQDYPPTLLLHGENDGDVPYEQSVLMAEAFQAHNVEHRLITMPGGPHGFDYECPDDPNVIQAKKEVVEFLEQHLSSGILKDEPREGRNG